MPKAGALTKDNPARAQRDAMIAQGRLQGATYRELATRHGVDPATIHRVLTDPEVKDIVETGQRQMLTLIPKAVDNYRVLLDDPDSKIRLMASKDVSQTAGILPTHMQSLVVNQVYNDNRQQIISPDVLALLKSSMGHGGGDLQREAVIEAESVSDSADKVDT